MMEVTYIPPGTKVEYAGVQGVVVHAPYKECLVLFSTGEKVWILTCDLTILPTENK